MLNNKGITLISLVITIIVLFIIASVASISGISTVRYIKYTNAKSQFEVMQSKVNEWYKISKTDSSVENYGSDLSQANSQDVANTLVYGTGSNNAKGYKYFSADYIQNELDIQGISYDFLINIDKYTVLLLGGIKYKNKIRYSAEDFEINKIRYDG